MTMEIDKSYQRMVPALELAADNIESCALWWLMRTVERDLLDDTEFLDLTRLLKDYYSELEESTSDLCNLITPEMLDDPLNEELYPPCPKLVTDEAYARLGEFPSNVLQECLFKYGSEWWDGDSYYPENFQFEDEDRAYYNEEICAHDPALYHQPGVVDEEQLPRVAYKAGVFFDGCLCAMDAVVKVGVLGSIEYENSLTGWKFTIYDGKRAVYIQ